MRKFHRRYTAGVVVALTCLLPLLQASPAQAGDPLKPYVVFILDTSGSMGAVTNAGPTSCGTSDTRLNHAKCAINKISNSYGDMVLALGRFKQTSTSTFSTSCTADCSVTGACTADDTSFELLTSLVDGSNAGPASFTDNECTTCASTGAGSLEVYRPGGNTPLGGSLLGVRRYWQGLQATDTSVIWPSTAPGFSPIFNDPTKDVFLTPTQQCRPYITILLTDGNETCSGSAPAAAAALLSTQVGTKNYRILTKPIGFGINPGDADIEAIAHSGGAPNVTGVNEGSYAANEEELQLAVSKIIADSVRSEVCNNLDDDCDTRIDEDFPSKGGACNNGQLGICRGTGLFGCRADGTGTQCNITNPGATAGSESCNNLDDDCDGLTDEGVCGVSCGDVEICNNVDDDCDGNIDEALTRPCGSGVGDCRIGVETCSAGMWGGCTGVNPTTETCDGRDNDCDGTRDGIAQSCSTLPGGVNPNQGICRPGIQTCPPGGAGTFGACLGEIQPRVEACNLLDDDCDGLTDETTGGARCSTTCGVGTTVCVNGQLTCDAQPATTDDTCDGNDDDCDGIIDENAVDMGACDGGGTICGGVLVCQGGRYQCSGGTPVRQESCDCSDNDCDNKVDEDPNCPAGSACTNCQCAFACGPGEFPCPSGKICQNNFCVNDLCFNKVCDPTPAGEKTLCLDGACVPACSQLNCGSTEVCDPGTGTCLPDNCTTFPDRCTASQNCIAGVCVNDACAGVSCPSGEFCTGGQCVGSCAGVQCPTGKFCARGECVATMCPDGCPQDTFCNETSGRCDASLCPGGGNCGQGQLCEPRTGECSNDPCVGITCPGSGQVCRNGSCYDPNNLPPDGTKQQFVTTGGGGCATGGNSSGAVAMLFALLLVALPRRTRAAQRGQGGAQ